MFTRSKKLINELLTHEINASAFLIDADLLATAEAKGCKNNLECAVRDLFCQLVGTAVLPEILREIATHLIAIQLSQTRKTENVLQRGQMTEMPHAEK